MKITEVDSNNRISVPKTNRNKVICDSIKPPLPNKPATFLISARPNSGKGVLCESIIKKQYKRCFDSVIVCMPPTSRSCFKNSILQHADEKKVFDDLNEETVEEIYELVVQTRDEGDEQEPPEEYYSLLLLDDVQAALRNKHVERKFRAMLANYRHLNLTILCSVQTIMSVSKSCRDLFRCLMQFREPSRLVRQRLHDEWAGQLDKEQFAKLLEYVWDKKHNFLFIDREKNQFCKNLNVLKLQVRPKEQEENPDE